ncbi:lysis protein [Pseudomonas sp. LS-2]|uniref:lysis protein n=1 Tax=Pseudomonas sp. LS-2 TaxID=2315859 RepID=UPI001C49C823|nr:lysis protein [Pseudomonas sp. LS-2]
MIAALKLVPAWVWGVVVLVIALCVGSFAAAWFWQANAYGKVIATNVSSYQSDRTLIANAASAQARDALAKQQEAEQKLAALDKTSTEQKDKANAENESLRRAVADGTRRLRIAGTCSAGSGNSNVSQATSTTSVGDAGSVELSRETGQAVLDLRRALISDQAALRAAQAYIRHVCR